MAVLVLAPAMFATVSALFKYLKLQLKNFATRSTPTPKPAKHAAKLFENGQQIIVPNSFHVTATGDEDNCASVITQRFVRDLDPGDTSCTNHIAEVHVVPKFLRASFSRIITLCSIGTRFPVCPGLY